MLKVLFPAYLPQLVPGTHYSWVGWSRPTEQVSQSCSSRTDTTTRVASHSPVNTAIGYTIYDTAGARRAVRFLAQKQEPGILDYHANAPTTKLKAV